MRLPHHTAGMRIGLYGGSFNPPHAAHLMVSRLALRRLGLDRVWWLVTPGNPLKHNGNLPPLETRLAAADALIDDPRIKATGVEADLGTRYSVDTIRALKARCSGVSFVWIMGADNLGSFDRWRGWREIANLVPLAIVDRPGYTHRAVHGHAAQALAAYRLDEKRAKLLAGKRPPAWVFLHGPKSPLSSTWIRQAGQKAFLEGTRGSPLY